MPKTRNKQTLFQEETWQTDLPKTNNTQESEETKMKRAFVLLLTFTMLILTGCSAVDAKLEQIILEKSGILEHEDYLQYKQYQEAGSLNENGQYQATGSNDSDTNLQDEPSGTIHVTFADNRYLKICYYTEAAMTTPLDVDACYLNPGDFLYAKVIECINPNSNLYRLAEYRIVEYDAEGNIKKEYQQEVKDGTLEFEIPNNFSGSELSVMPVGEYPDRNLSMSVYYVDDNGNECSLGNAGTWSINNESIEGNSAQISPIESYVLKFDYDTKNYFYVGCEPGCFTKDPTTAGFVEFWEAEPTDADMSYRVELHKFLELSLKFSDEARVSINKGETETVKKNKVWNPGKLQYGDSITVETAGECTIVGGDYRHISATKDPITGGYRYTLKVVQNATSNTADVLTLTVDVNRIFKVTLGSNCNYGTCVYKLDGNVVSGEVQVQEGQKLTLTYKITKDNYSFAEKSGGIGGFFHDLFKASERTITIPITADLDETTIDPDDWFDIVERGE